MRARSTAALGLLLLTVPVVAVAEAPDNDSRDEAERISRLPADVRGSTTDAETGPADGLDCGEPAGSVWYRIDPGRTRRVVVRLKAGGDLEATLDVYERSRSRHDLVTCEETDRRGSAAVAFRARKGQPYLIRVARLKRSRDGDFRLTLRAAGATRLPGPPLPENGVSGTLDRLERTASPWSVAMRPGRRYRIALQARRGCMRASVYRAGIRPRRGLEPLLRLGCSGYGAFTPRPEHGRRFTVFVNAASDVRGAQRYHLQVGRAGVDDVAPGVPARNYERIAGRLGATLDTVDLYRFDVARRSVLFLNLRTRRSEAPLDLLLLNESGDIVRCDCDGRGNATLHKGLRPGRFFVAARTRGGVATRYSLLRASRTITNTTSVRVNGAAQASLLPGQAASLTATVEPGASGPAVVTIEQFDPIEGWQYADSIRTTAVGGFVSASYVPRAEGRWRATARFVGTREVAPSRAPGFVPFTVGGPLTD